MALAESFVPDQERPLVSIGVPVFNSALTLEKTLDSLVAQTFENFELIISDNGSTDATAAICLKYAERDQRIRYVRQPKNLGATLNFKFVFNASQGKYFLWVAGDDTRSSDFLMENVEFLEKNPSYVASTSPNCFEGRPVNESLVSFSIEATTAQERFRQFFEHCWKSHGIFYSVIRTDILRECDIVGQSFFAADWAIDLFLASRGNIHRTSKGLMTFGLNGISSKSSSYKVFRNQFVELLLPFYRLSCVVLRLGKRFPFSAKWEMLIILTKLNLRACWDQAYSALYQFYRRHLKNKISSANVK